MRSPCAETGRGRASMFSAGVAPSTRCAIVMDFMVIGSHAVTGLLAPGWHVHAHALRQRLQSLTIDSGTGTPSRWFCWCAFHPLARSRISCTSGISPP
jgi:hypothetical protein